MISKLLYGSNNINKLKEVKQKLKEIEILSPSNFNIAIEPKETGLSFKENAIIKAKYYSEKTNLITFADDSGLEIEYLNGAPGIYSKRYGKTNIARMNKVLSKLKGVKNRKAKFVCVIALYNPITRKSFIFEGYVLGFINEKPIGNNGFGYDPIFFYPPLKKTFAQLSLNQKNKISHRANSLKKLIVFLRNTQIFNNDF